jgi:hypothetical protein
MSEKRKGQFGSLNPNPASRGGPYKSRRTLLKEACEAGDLKDADFLWAIAELTKHDCLNTNPLDPKQTLNLLQRAVKPHPETGKRFVTGTHLRTAIELIKRIEQKLEAAKRPVAPAPVRPIPPAPVAQARETKTLLPVSKKTPEQIEVDQIQAATKLARERFNKSAFLNEAEQRRYKKLVDPQLRQSTFFYRLLDGSLVDCEGKNKSDSDPYVISIMPVIRVKRSPGPNMVLAEVDGILQWTEKTEPRKQTLEQLNPWMRHKEPAEITTWGYNGKTEPVSQSRVFEPVTGTWLLLAGDGGFVAPQPNVGRTPEPERTISAAETAGVEITSRLWTEQDNTGHGTVTVKPTRKWTMTFPNVAKVDYDAWQKSGFKDNYLPPNMKAPYLNWLQGLQLK